MVGGGGRGKVPLLSCVCPAAGSLRASSSQPDLPKSGLRHPPGAEGRVGNAPGLAGGKGGTRPVSKTGGETPAPLSLREKGCPQKDTHIPQNPTDVSRSQPDAGALRVGLRGLSPARGAGRRWVSGLFFLAFDVKRFMF